VAVLTDSNMSASERVLFTLSALIVRYSIITSFALSDYSHSFESAFCFCCKKAVELQVRNYGKPIVSLILQGEEVVVDCIDGSQWRGQFHSVDQSDQTHQAIHLSHYMCTVSQVELFSLQAVLLAGNLIFARASHCK